MKKVLFIFILTLISISCFSQKVKVVKSKGYYDSNNTPYIKTTIANNTLKKIVCLVFTIEYNFPSIWDVERYKEVTVKTTIFPKTSKTISYYPPSNYYRPLHQTLSRVIFSDGTYISN